jgi:hypothetical protein
MLTKWDDRTADEKADLLREELGAISGGIDALEMRTNKTIARLEKTIAEQAEEIAFLKRLTSPRG